MLKQSFYEQNAVSLAQALLGCELVHQTDAGVVAGIIVETEAYDQTDPASHSFRGLTKRNAVMFGPGGFAYIYLTYGMHYCFNVVAGTDKKAEAVLIRALEPTQGVSVMQERRRTSNIHNLCSGPAKLVQALGLRYSQNGDSLASKQLHIKQRLYKPAIISGPRVGITKAANKPWRFYIADNPFVSKAKLNNLAVE